MTISLVARDPSTGAFGIVVSSSSPAVASRCLHLRGGVGAAASQNVTNPALGTAVLDALEDGLTAHHAIARAIASEPHADFRQLLTVDTSGRTASYTGARALGICGEAAGNQVIAAGNLLAADTVAQAAIDAYTASAEDAFEDRLLDALHGALAAGGEAGPLRSAGLAVVESVPWRVTDLRVDDSADPVGELARLLRLWMPQKEQYLTRALHPDAAPSYGVPGDL